MSGTTGPLEPISAYRCTCFCGHQWVAEFVPKRCARCKSRKWDDHDRRPVVKPPSPPKTEDIEDIEDPFAETQPLPAVLGTRKTQTLSQIQETLAKMRHSPTCSCFICRPPKSKP
jgi:hypothetical protein